MPYNYLKKIPLILFVVTSMVFSQEEPTTDELYTQARNAAFEEDDYPKAVALLKRALAKSPDYLEISVFLGRIYTYSDSLQKARMTFEEVLQKEKGHVEASFAYGNLEYWNDNSKAALEVVKNGIEVHPESEKLVLLKAKILKDLKRYEEATSTLQKLLKANPKLTEARSLIGGINSSSAKNEIGLNYEFLYFDKRFDAPWHITMLDFTRQTKIGSVAARLNYANRFESGAFQFEIDAYPRISDLFYTYVNFGISDDTGVFPKYRAGFSLFANLPAAFEVDGGFRYLGFGESTFIYTAGVGKYYKNYWFNVRTYLTPSDFGLSQSYSLTVRYYLGGADDFIGARIGSGISPDDSSNSVLFNDDPTLPNVASARLRSTNFVLSYRKLFKDTNVFTLQSGIENQEFRPDTRGIQFSVSVGYIKRF